MHVVALAPAHMTELTVTFSCQRRTLRSTTDMWKSVDMRLLQVGCPEARIDENVAKLTGAGYKVSLHKLLAPVGCTWPFATHTATCRSSLHMALCNAYCNMQKWPLLCKYQACPRDSTIGRSNVGAAAVGALQSTSCMRWDHHIVAS